VKALGIDLVHFGIVMTVNMAIGQITPPVGVNLFVACRIARIRMNEISQAVLPMVVAQAAALAVICVWPDLSLFLTRFMR
jgi:C4-dicarboxylate transporter DctM subunit